MIANYHTHTWRCLHAKGTEREYVERAIQGGIRVLGFSDHTPYPFPKSYFSGMRMELNQMEDYTDKVLALKKEYRHDIEIHLGVEAEYYPLFWEELMDFLKDYPVEYMLLAQHHLDSEVNGAFYSGRSTDNPVILKKYMDQCIEAMKKGKFLYFAHPDLLNFCGDEECFDREYRRLCRAANEAGLPLEINFLGIGEKRWYPRPDFWKIAGEEGSRVILGCDAHEPANTWNPDAEEKAMALVRKYGLNLVETLPMT